MSPGDKLMVPHEATVLMAARADRPVPAAESRALVADAVVPAVTASKLERVKVTYRVKSGDTLALDRARLRTSVAALKTWNRISGTRASAPATASRSTPPARTEASPGSATFPQILRLAHDLVRSSIDKIAESVCSLTGPSP